MLIRPLRRTALAAALTVLTLTAGSACTSTPGSATANPATPAPPAAPRVTPMTDISAGCPGNSSEVEEVTPDQDQAPHIVESAGGRAGVAYVAWQTSGTGPGYAIYLRPYSVRRGWLGPAVKVSAAYGNVRIWPGDTFGIAVLPDGDISMTWGSAVGTHKVSAIYASVVTT